MLDSNVKFAKDAGIAAISSMNANNASLHTTNTTPVSVTAAPASGQKIVIDDIILSSDTAMTIRFTEETSGIDVIYVRVPAGVTIQITPRGKLKLSTADKKVNAIPGAAGDVYWNILWHSES